MLKSSVAKYNLVNSALSIRHGMLTLNEFTMF